MITQEDINREMDLAKRIYLYYLDKYADNLSIGSSNYISWYKDLCNLYYITDCLQSVYLADGVPYVGSYEIDEDNFNIVTKAVREFINYDIRDIVYTNLDNQSKVKDYQTPAIPPTIVSYQSFNQDWRSVLITITVDDITELTMPFNIANVDPDSIRVTVNDNDPVFVSAPENEGIHFIGTTLYWHTYYSLKIDDVVQIQYLINNV